MPMSGTAAGKAKIRVQLDLSVSEVEALDSLRAVCSLRSRAEAVRTALAVLEWVQTEAQSGQKILSVGNDGILQFVVPGLTTTPPQD